MSINLDAPYEYKGDDSNLQALYAQLAVIRKLANHLTIIIMGVERIKSILGETSYQKRLTVAIIKNAHDGADLAWEQESQRAEYYRLRMLLNFYIVPRLEEASGIALNLANNCTEQLRSSPEVQLALGQLLTALEFGEMHKQLVKAREIIDEDVTNGAGELAFNSFIDLLCLTRGPFPLLWKSNLPCDAQVADLDGDCAIALELVTLCKKILPVVEDYRKDLAHADWLRAPLEYQLRYPEIRLRAHACIDFYTEQHTQLVRLIKNAVPALRTTRAEALSTNRDQSQRFLAQSNCFGALIIANELHSVFCRAHNNFVLGGGNMQEYVRFLRTTFDKLLSSI